MKKLFIALAFLIFFNSNSFSQSFTRYNFDGSNKCQGLKFSIKYPSNWTKMDTDSPHIVKKFSIDEKRGLVQMVVYINKSDVTPTQSEIEDLYSKDHFLSIFRVKKVIEYNNQGKVNGERYSYASIQVEDVMNNQTVRSIFRANSMVWKEYLIQINFAIFSNDQSFETMTKMYNDYNGSFKDIMSSLVINANQ